MKLVIFSILLFFSVSCTAQEPLKVEKKAIIFFRLDENEFDIKARNHPDYYELDSDYGTGIVPFIDSLECKKINHVMTTNAVIQITHSNITYTINTKNGESSYGVIFYDGSNCPLIIYGAHPSEYYFEILDKSF